MKKKEKGSIKKEVGGKKLDQRTVRKKEREMKRKALGGRKHSKVSRGRNQGGRRWREEAIRRK